MTVKLYIYALLTTITFALSYIAQFVFSSHLSLFGVVVAFLVSPFLLGLRNAFKRVHTS